MIQTERAKQTAAQYGDAAGSGIFGGAAIGGLLAGRRGVIPGAIIGGAATIAGRRALSPKVRSLQDQDRQIKSALVGSIPATVATAVGATALIKGRSIGRLAKKAGNSFRDFKARPGVGKTTHMQPTDYRDIVMEPKPIAGLLKRFSERDELSAIINLKAVDLGYTYPSYPSTSPESSTKKNYPSLYIDDREHEIDLPLSGSARVKFKMRSKTTRQDEDGKKRHSANIEIQSIDPIDEEIEQQPGAAKPLKLLQSELSGIIQFDVVRRKKIKPRKQGVQLPPMDEVPGDSAGSTTVMSARDELSAILQFGNDPRPRNRLGEFSDEESGINQQAIHATYRQGLAEGAAGGALAVKGTQALAKVLKKARR